MQRKVKEACLATKLDRAWSKQRILTTYLNQVYYGNHAYGIEAAAETYFSVHAERLDLSQAALIAGLTQAPSVDDPFTAPARALARRHEVLTRCSSRVRSVRASTATRSLPRSTLRPGKLYKQDPRAVLLRLRARQAHPGVRRRATVRSGGLKVYTTIVPRYQRLAERAVRETLTAPDRPRGGAHLDQPALGRHPRDGRRHPEPSEERVQPAFAGTPAARLDVQDVRPHGRGRAGINPDSTYYVSAPFTYRAHPAATATTAPGGASTRMRTTTTAGARSGARRSAPTTPSTRS